MNLRHAKKMFHDLNQKHFFGLLSIPTFVKFSNNVPPENPRVEFGTDAIMGAYLDNTIWYHRKLSAKKLRATIAHEMVHQFQDFSGWHSTTHGKEFTDTAQLIERIENIKVIL